YGPSPCWPTPDADVARIPYRPPPSTVLHPLPHAANRTPTVCAFDPRRTTTQTLPSSPTPCAAPWGTVSTSTSRPRRWHQQQETCGSSRQNASWRWDGPGRPTPTARAGSPRSSKVLNGTPAHSKDDTRHRWSGATRGGWRRG